MCLEQSVGHNEEERAEERKKYLMRSYNICNLHPAGPRRSNHGG
jgi:hypothetical protein